ncbi:MAG: hypothetical protein NUV61_00725, partial [Candidatus Azambacteria bacterium]|nr:hypothetical protein [Candidatus Azambacteria bacterium]
MSSLLTVRLDKIKKLFIILLVSVMSGVLVTPVFVRADTATIPPADIVDLAVVGVGSSSIQLTWSAPGADGYVEPATAYDMRVAQYSFTMGAWNSLTRVSSTPVPGQPGIQESFAVIGLSPA